VQPRSALAGLRLAVLAPISRALPPAGYGPWEQIAIDVADGASEAGLDVTLFASGDSRPRGKLRSVIPVGLSGDEALDGDVYTALHIAALFERAGDFDLIHNHFDWKPLTYALATQAPPMVTTVHGFSRPQILAAYYAGAARSFFCSISAADRDPGLDYLATVHNGIDPHAFTFVDRAGEYLLFLGRFHPEKGAHRAIAVAARAGVRLVLAGIPQDVTYFEREIAPHVDGDRVRFVGPVAGAARDALLGGALALVHLTTRPERFGLTLVEAMACGTPVLGANQGSVPEIVVDGVTGFVCDDDDAAVARVPDLAALDRRACRARVEAAFTRERMVDRYLDAYAVALTAGRPPVPSPEHLAARAHDFWDRPQAFTDLGERPRTLRSYVAGGSG